MRRAFLMTKRYLFLSGFLFIIAIFSSARQCAPISITLRHYRKDWFRKDLKGKRLFKNLQLSRWISFDTKGVSLFFVHREASLNYNQYPSTLSVVGARIYMKTYEKELSKAEEKYGVDRDP